MSSVSFRKFCGSFELFRLFLGAFEFELLRGSLLETIWTRASQNSEPERLSGNSKAPRVPFPASWPGGFALWQVNQRMSEVSGI